MSSESTPKTKLQILRQTLILSAIVSAAAACIGAVYSLVVIGHVRLQYIINANLLVGAMVVSASLAVLFLPARIKGEGPIDHTNYAELVMKARDKKRARAYEILYVGLGVFAIAGIVEVLMWR